MEILTLIGCLLGTAANHAVGFFVLAGSVRFLQAVRLSCTALGLNKILFTGTGYLASAYYSQVEQIHPSKAIAVFLLLEVVFFSGWIACGLYFGGRLLLAVPYGLAVLVVALCVALAVKRKKAQRVIREALSHGAGMGMRVLAAFPLALVNLALSLLYYSTLFGYFGFYAPAVTVLKIVSISLTAGYLSPAPGGLGFKDAGMVALLMDQGVPAGAAVAIAFWDRVIITAVWAALGVGFAFGPIKAEVAKRVRRRGGQKGAQ